MNILGIGGILHDAAAALVCDGELIAAAEQRKLLRAEQPGELPLQAVAECLRIAGLQPADIHAVSIARPWVTGTEERIHLELRERFSQARVVVVDHQLAHAASAFFASPFAEATVLTLDRLGDFRCGARWNAAGDTLLVDRELYYPDSLGDIWGRVTRLLGFHAHADEHKVQWLSASGSPRFVEGFRQLFHVSEDGWPSVRREFLDTHTVAEGTFRQRFFGLLGVDPQALSAADRQDIAFALQQVTAETVLAMAGNARHLCLAGGVGFNAMLVEALEQSGRFAGVFVQPAAGNSGTALGAALYGWHFLNPGAAKVELRSMCLGPEYGKEAIKQVLENCKLNFRHLLTTENLIQAAITALNEDRIVAWMQGRMEFGPRALGNRSILASPLNPYSTENLNTYIKHRESFRKFAASVPEEDAATYFAVGENARFLATVGRVRAEHRERFSHALLGEDIARIHTVREQDNPLFYRLLKAQGAATGLPVLYNTSFNLFQDPLVCTPRDAVRSFYSSGIDELFVGHFQLGK